MIRSVLDGYSPACVAPQNRTLSLQEQKLRHRDCFVGINDPLEKLFGERRVIRVSDQCKQG